MNNNIYRGVLISSGPAPFLLGEDSTRFLEGEKIWSQYLVHFSGLPVCARLLPQLDYDTKKPIIIIWPDEPVPREPFVELYFNERLIKYPTSFLGHLAVNVNGEIFNFSHLMNENEIMKHEDYFFRPALGEFAPHPVSGRYNADNPQRPYYDKFGRLFMRTIHVLRISGLDTQSLSQIFHNELKTIRNTPPDPKNPEKYANFNIFTRSCSTIIREGFQRNGFAKIRGIFPRDLFVNIAYYFLEQSQQHLIKCYTRKQLKVPEAPLSALPPLTNPWNYYRYHLIKRKLTDTL